MSAFLFLILFIQQASPKSELQDKLRITAIEVEGTRWVSAEVIRSEAHLEVPNDYDEAQLALALRRIRRLPFVHETHFSLRKGEQYGTYQLVIHIREASSLFYQYQRVVQQGDRVTDSSFGFLSNASETAPELGDCPAGDESCVGQLVPTNRLPSLEPEHGQLDLGIRWFLGPRTMLYGTLALKESLPKIDFAEGQPWNLGLIQYDLFHRGGVLNLNLQNRAVVEERRFDIFQVDQLDVKVERKSSPSLALAVPFHEQNWFSFNLDYFDEKQTYLLNRMTGSNSQIRDRRLTITGSWYFNTLDDPLIPRRGLRQEAGIEAIQQQSQLVLETNASIETDSGLAPDYRRKLSQDRIQDESLRSGEFFLSGESYWPAGQYFHLGLESEARYRIWESSAQIRDAEHWGLMIHPSVAWTPRLPWGKVDDLFQIDASFRVKKDYFRTYEQLYLNFEIQLLYRQRWGLLRLSIQYVDLDLNSAILYTPDQVSVDQSGHIIVGGVVVSSGTVNP